MRRGGLPLAVVAAVRPGEGEPLPATGVIHLGVLGRDAAAELVGPARADALYERSKGHPLFLTELAQQAPGGPLPASLVESVSARCDELGPAGALLRTAAVIGSELDIDLLAAVLGRGVVELLDDAERAVTGQFLADEDGTLQFRHELLREALAASATAGRAALLHRQAGRVLARRPDADPVMVAQHARLGGDLRWPRARCGTRPRGPGSASTTPRPRPCWMTRCCCIPIRRGGWRGPGSAPAAAATPRPWRMSSAPGSAGPAALEAGAWASYFGRRFAQAAQFAEDGALAAVDPATRARCLAVGGRTHHAAGDLARAEQLLGEAFSLAEGADRVTAAAWLGVLRSHQSRPAEALPLLRPAARGHVGVEHTSATLARAAVHRARARARGAPSPGPGRVRALHRGGGPAAAAALRGPRGELQRLGAAQPGRSRGGGRPARRRAGDRAAPGLPPRLTIAALEDLAEQCLDPGDPDGARARLAEAAALLHGDLVFGWRLDLKHQLVTGRLALLSGDPGQAAAVAAGLESRAAALGVPRYASVARLLRHRADRALGQPVDLACVQADLDLLDASVAVEAWWWTGEVAAEFANPPGWTGPWTAPPGWPGRRRATRTGCGGTQTSACAAGGPWPAEPAPPPAPALLRPGPGSPGREDQHGDDQRPGARPPPARRRAARPPAARRPATGGTGRRGPCPAATTPAAPGPTRRSAPSCVHPHVGEPGAGRLVSRAAPDPPGRPGLPLQRLYQAGGWKPNGRSASSTASLAGWAQPGANVLAARPRPTRRISPGHRRAGPGG